jgi:hypothetical protein
MATGYNRMDPGALQELLRQAAAVRPDALASNPAVLAVLQQLEALNSLLQAAPQQHDLQEAAPGRGSQQSGPGAFNMTHRNLQQQQNVAASAGLASGAQVQQLQQLLSALKPELLAMQQQRVSPATGEAPVMAAAGAGSGTSAVQQLQVAGSDRNWQAVPGWQVSTACLIPSLDQLLLVTHVLVVGATAFVCPWGDCIVQGA